MEQFTNQATYRIGAAGVYGGNFYMTISLRLFLCCLSTNKYNKNKTKTKQQRNIKKDINKLRI